MGKWRCVETLMLTFRLFVDCHRGLVTRLNCDWLQKMDDEDSVMKLHLQIYHGSCTPARFLRSVPALLLRVFAGLQHQNSHQRSVVSASQLAKYHYFASL